MIIVSRTQFHSWVNARLAKCLNSVLNVKLLVGAFNQEKALVGAFSVIVQLRQLIVCSTIVDLTWLEKLEKLMQPWNIFPISPTKQLATPSQNISSMSGGISVSMFSANNSKI